MPNPHLVRLFQNIDPYLLAPSTITLIYGAAIALGFVILLALARECNMTVPDRFLK